MASVPTSIGRIQERLGEKVREAYFLAAAVHAGQQRQSGVAYIEHPLAVAEILFALSADTDLICAALLHDVLEECDDEGTIEEEIHERFGDHVAYLVRAVSKDRRHGGSEEIHGAYLEQIGCASGPDPFILFLKVADLLDNLRTVEFLSTARRALWLYELKYDYLPLFADCYHCVPLPYQRMYHHLLGSVQSGIPAQE